VLGVVTLVLDSESQTSEHHEISNLMLPCSYPEQGKIQKTEADEYFLNPRATVRHLCSCTLHTGRRFFLFFFFYLPLKYWTRNTSREKDFFTFVIICWL